MAERRVNNHFDGDKTRLAGIGSDMNRTLRRLSDSQTTTTRDEADFHWSAVTTLTSSAVPDRVVHFVNEQLAV